MEAEARLSAPITVDAVRGDDHLARLPDTARSRPAGSTAMSTMTLPGRIRETASTATISGGRRPGTCAVVMTTSCLTMWSVSSACCASPALRR